MNCQRETEGFYKGDDVVLSLEIVQPDGSKMDFGGKKIIFILKKNRLEPDDKAVLLKEYQPQSGTLLKIPLTAKETDIAAGVYQFAVRVVVNGTQTTEGEGTLKVMQGVFYGA